MSRGISTAGLNRRGAGITGGLNPSGGGFIASAVRPILRFVAYVVDTLRWSTTG